MGETGRMDGISRPDPVLEVFADVCCPFTHVGLRRLADHRRRVGRSDVVLWVRAWPLETVNGAPLDPEMIAEEVDALRASVAPDLFGSFDPSMFPSTSIPAMALAAAGYRRDARTGEAVSLELRDLLFEHARDISDPAVLADVERRFMVRSDPRDVESVRTDHADGRERGVTGSPHFFTTHDSFFCPTLDITRDDDGHLKIAQDEAGFDRFMAVCFT